MLQERLRRGDLRALTDPRLPFELLVDPQAVWWTDGLHACLRALASRCVRGVPPLALRQALLQWGSQKARYRKGNDWKNMMGLLKRCARTKRLSHHGPNQLLAQGIAVRLVTAFTGSGCRSEAGRAENRATLWSFVKFMRGMRTDPLPPYVTRAFQVLEQYLLVPRKAGRCFL